MSTQHTGVTRTHPEIPRMALVFDYDDTLAPDTWDGLLTHLGVDPDAFDRAEVDPRVRDGWSKIPARFYALVQESQRREDKITRERLQAYGESLESYPGVEDMFAGIRARAAQTAPNVEVLFYIVSSGFGDIIRASRIARQFDGIWGCDFHFSSNGEIAFPKVIVEHTEKPRYLHLVEKGVEKYLKKPAYEVFRHLPEDELHVPLHQMIYVGDGSSDVACFTLLNAHHGVALGVNKPNTPVHWGEDGVEAEERIDDIAAPDYREGSELLRSLFLAVDSIGARIALAKQPDRD